MHVTATVATITPSHPLYATVDELCWNARALRNKMNYDHRQGFFDNKKPTELSLRKQYTRDKVSEWSALPAKIARDVSRELDSSWSSFFTLLSRWTQGLLPAKPRVPGYYRGKTRGVVTVAKDTMRRSFAHRGFLSFAGLPKGDALCPLPCSWKRVKTARLVPRGHVIDVMVVYDKKPTASPGDRVAGLDLGVDNLATVACDDPYVRPLIVDGRHVKSINRHANKKASALRSALPAGKRTSHAIQSVWRVRNRRVKADLHWASNQVIEYLRDNKVGTLYVGWNKGWKSATSSKNTMGRVGNQRFRSLPLRQFVDLVTYKATLNGIVVVETEESYTSKTSVLDGELPSRRENYAGRRVHRGLFCSATGGVLNADVNGACQIVRKCKPEAFSWAEGVVGAVGLMSPVRVSLGGGHPMTYRQIRHKMNMCGDNVTCL